MAEPRRNRVTVVMEDSLKHNIDMLAEKTKRTRSDCIRLALWEYLEAIQEDEEESE